MDGSYRADLGALDDLMRQMKRFDADAETITADLDGEVARLHEQWTGAAAETHAAAHRAWTAGAIQMRTALVTLHQIVATAHANYGAAIDAGRAMWR